MMKLIQTLNIKMEINDKKAILQSYMQNKSE